MKIAASTSFPHGNARAWCALPPIRALKVGARARWKESQTRFRRRSTSLQDISSAKIRYVSNITGNRCIAPPSSAAVHTICLLSQVWTPHFGTLLASTTAYPSYMLLGGNVRDRIRVYAHWGIRDASNDKALEAARTRLDMLSTMGYTAYKSGPEGFWRAHEPPSRIDKFVEAAYMMREWVGDDVELCFDFHGKMAPGLAIEVCNELKGMRPMFVEEPVPQENEDALKLVSDHVPFPIATGERLLTRWEFRRVIEQQCVSLLQPDVAHCGGITELKKIANYAEVYYQHIMPHCAIGPLALAACMTVDAVVPNFLVQEQVDQALGDGIIKKDWQVKDGHIELWDEPGLGVEVDETEATKVFEGDAMGYHRELGGETYFADGSVADW